MTTQIATTATALGYTITTDTRTDGHALIARDDTDTVRMYANYIGKRFDSGFTVDDMGHTTSHTTIRDLIAYTR